MAFLGAISQMTFLSDDSLMTIVSGRARLDDFDFARKLRSEGHSPICVTGGTIGL